MKKIYNEFLDKFINLLKINKQSKQILYKNKK